MKPKNSKNVTQQQPSPLTITIYTKEFNSFVDSIKELRELDPEIKKILTTDSNIDNPDLIEADSTYVAARDVYTYFESVFPDIVERKNLHTSLTISATKVMLKTNMFFTLDWKFKYDKECNITDVRVSVTTFTKNNKPLLINEVLKADKTWVEKK